MSWEVVPGPSDEAREMRRFPWWIPLAVGIFVIAAALGLLVWPFVAASWVLVVLLGAALVANGLAMLVRQRRSAATAWVGVLIILAGVLAIVFSEFTVGVLVTFVGASVIFLGILWLMLGVRAGAGFAALLPAILMMLAGVFALIWPEVALAFVAVIGGLIMLVLGVTIVATSLALRRALRGGPQI